MSESVNPVPSNSPSEDKRAADAFVERLAFAALVEQRRNRRWGIFFKSVFLLYLVVVLILAFSPLDPTATDRSQPHAALVNLEGLIASGMDANAKDVISGLRSAFKNDSTTGVILSINSPGGSPVQAGEMYDEIMRLREAHPDTPIYAVATDVCASGGYYVAAATQKIYANKASIIGSIGVRTDGFGFVDAMSKLGITRRLYTSGESKGFLDPFQPPKPEDVRHLESMLDEIHQQFIAAVRQGRGERLQETPELFSGLVWTGSKSLELGLIDELADVRFVAKEVIGTEKIIDYTKRPKVLERILSNVEATLTLLTSVFSPGVR
ncbi:MAG: S49 family peptidase [Candidatus Competibacteraceae bacterium]|nr:S49 family peptidase [Candidatus Competibacteraceae bacterium]